MITKRIIPVSYTHLEFQSDKYQSADVFVRDCLKPVSYTHLSKSDGAFGIILLYLASTGLLYRGMGK